jgi:hypothetical protein
MSGFGPVTQIYIGGKKPSVMRNLLIDNISVSQANYAILRQVSTTRWTVPASPTANLAISRGCDRVERRHQRSQYPDL